MEQTICSDEGRPATTILLASAASAALASMSADVLRPAGSRFAPPVPAPPETECSLQSVFCDLGFQWLPGSEQQSPQGGHRRSRIDNEYQARPQRYRQAALAVWLGQSLPVGDQ